MIVQELIELPVFDQRCEQQIERFVDVLVQLGFGITTHGKAQRHAFGNVPAGTCILLEDPLQIGFDLDATDHLRPQPFPVTFGPL